jgi:hypothetical protein
MEFSMQTTLLRLTAGCTLLVGVALVTGGCASVPKEAVELSYQVGEDLSELHSSYDKMVVERFKDFRAEREAYLEDEWIPIFLRDFMKRGRLVDVAKGDVILDEKINKFVAPTPGREEVQLHESVLGWSKAASKKIEAKRQELMSDLDKREASVREDLQKAFGRLIRANAQITAHLNSIRKVQKIQDSSLDRLGLKEAIDKVNDKMVGASDWAEKSLEKVREADAKLDKTAAKVQDAKDDLDGGNN